MNFQSVSSTDKVKDLQNSCRRKRARGCGKFVNDSSGADPPCSAADELYSDCSGRSTRHKKQKVNDSCRFHQKSDDVLNRTFTDDVQESNSHDSSQSQTGRNITEPANSAQLEHDCDEPHVALDENEPQSSNFEELLFGLISESECSQVVYNKCDAACVVESNGKREHRGDTSSSMSDSSSDSSHADISNSIGWVDVSSPYSMESSHAHLGGTSCLLSTYASNNGNNAASASGMILAHSKDNKTDLSPSANKQNEDKKPEKWTADCIQLFSESGRCERKPKSKKHHAPASPAHSQTFSNDRNQFSLLRRVHRTMSPHGAGCGKTPVQNTVDNVEHCSELNYSGIENMSSGEPGYCRELTPSRKHKKHATNKKVTISTDCGEFASSRSSCHRKKKHREHTSTLVNNLSLSTDNFSLCSNKEHSTIVGERLAFGSTSGQAVDHLDSGVHYTKCEPETEDDCCPVPAFDKEQNVFKKQVTSTEDSVESHSLPRRKKKKKKKRREDDKAPTYAAEFSSPGTAGVGSPKYKDRLAWNVSCIEHPETADDSCTDLSEKQQNNCDKCEEVTEVVNSNDCTKSKNSGSTPHTTKSKKKMVSECSSPLTSANGGSPSPTLPVITGSVDGQKADVTRPSTQTAGVVFCDSVNNSEDVLLEKDLPQKCSTVECENTSVQKTSDKNDFEHLLLDVLISDKSSVSHSHFEHSNSIDPALSRKEHGCERTLSESSSDDDAVSSVSEGTDSRDNCSEHSQPVSDTTAMVCCDSTMENIQTITLHSEDESQTCNLKDRRQTDSSAVSINSHSCVDSLASSTTVVDTELSSKLNDRVQHQVSLLTDVAGSHLGPDSFSPNNSLSDSVGGSQSGQHTVSEVAASAMSDSKSDTGGIQLPNAQDHQHVEGEKDLLTEDSVDSLRSEMSDVECVSEAEQDEQATELTSKSEPSSPALFSADEEDRICSESSETDDESTAESEAVSSFCMKCKKTYIVGSTV